MIGEIVMWAAVGVLAGAIVAANLYAWGSLFVDLHRERQASKAREHDEWVEDISRRVALRVMKDVARQGVVLEDAIAAKVVRDLQTAIKKGAERWMSTS